MSRATHVRNFSNTGGLSAPPGVNSTVPNFVPRTKPDGVGLERMNHSGSPCDALLMLLCASRSHSVQVADFSRSNGYEPEGREFESLRARHSIEQLASILNLKSCEHL